MTQKDRDYIAGLYHRRFDDLYSYAITVLENTALAEEAVQETFRIACCKIDDIYFSESPDGWLTLTIRNVVRNALRSREAMKLLEMWMKKRQRDQQR